jgi:hypothetical protein
MPSLYTLCYPSLTTKDRQFIDEFRHEHDILFRDVVAPHLRLNIPYIPHIGIATIPDAHRIKALCEKLNSTDIVISGKIDTILVCSYDGAKIINLETFQCQE